jgi:exopolysaccharide biosynthesis protein
MGLMVLVLTCAACQSGIPREVPEALVAWVPVDSLNAVLPASVRVFSGVNRELPLAAWYVSVDLNDRNTSARVVVSGDTDFRETVADFARDEKACVAVNGGYFRMGDNPATHVGLLMSGGRIVEPAIGSVIRDGVRYPTARATMGITDGGRVHFGWVNSRNDSTIAWSEPPPNLPGHPAQFPDLSHASPWPVRDALAAGPRLLKGGAVDITLDEEVFFGSSIPEVHPRTASGISEDGNLILLVVDGRQRASRGVDLAELAQLLASTGAVDGINLDGGGSTSLIVAGVLVNRPVGDTFQREVMSAVVVDCAAGVGP